MFLVVLPIVVTLGRRCYTSRSKVTLPFWQTTSPFTSKTPNSHLCHQITSKSNSLPDGCVFISVIVGDYSVLVVLTVCVNLSSHFYKQTADGWSWKSESLAFLGTLTLSHDLFPFFVFWKKKGNSLVTFLIKLSQLSLENAKTFLARWDLWSFQSSGSTPTSSRWTSPEDL